MNEHDRSKGIQSNGNRDDGAANDGDVRTGLEDEQRSAPQTPIKTTKPTKVVNEGSEEARLKEEHEDGQEPVNQRNI